MSDERPPPLEYHHAPTERPPNMVSQCFVGAILTVVAIVGGVFVVFLGGFALTYGARGNNDRLVMIGMVAIGILSFLGINAFALNCVRSPRRRGIAWGIWIGLGVSLLIEGACFGGLRF